MNTPMHKLNGNRKLAGAIERCRQAHSRAVRLSATQVQVTGRTDNRYTVTLAAPKPGVLLAVCDCPAGRSNQFCFHIAAAVVVPGTVATGTVSLPASPTEHPAQHPGQHPGGCSRAQLPGVRRCIPPRRISLPVKQRLDSLPGLRRGAPLPRATRIPNHSGGSQCPRRRCGAQNAAHAAR